MPSWRHAPMIKPLQLGRLSLPNNLIQGPLAGISCAPFRLLTHRLGAPAFTCTEMSSTNTLARGEAHTSRYLYRHPDEGVVSYQISGHDPDIIAQATRVVIEAGADIVDLNCGCPVTKIRKKGAGSRLLAKPAVLAECVKAMRAAAGDVPISIKVRVDGDSTENNNADVARIAQEEGADFLIVHGRHWTERYDTPCRYDQIAEMVARVSIPVIGNGDVEDLASLKTLFATGCDGAMIARAGVGQPWLFEQLRQEAKGEHFVKPTWHTIGQYFIEHVQGLVQFEGECGAVLQARKLGKYYGRGLPQLPAFLSGLNQCLMLDGFIHLVLTYFQEHTISC